jgi:hypothetical protein
VARARSWGRGTSAFAVAEAELQAWRTRLESHGVEVLSEVAWEQGARSLYFRDPDGHLLELATPEFVVSLGDQQLILSGVALYCSCAREAGRARRIAARCCGGISGERSSPEIVFVMGDCRGGIGFAAGSQAPVKWPLN